MKKNFVYKEDESGSPIFSVPLDMFIEDVNEGIKNETLPIPADNVLKDKLINFLCAIWFVCNYPKEHPLRVLGREDYLCLPEFETYKALKVIDGDPLTLMLYAYLAGKYKIKMEYVTTSNWDYKGKGIFFRIDVPDDENRLTVIKKGDIRFDEIALYISHLLYVAEGGIELVVWKK